MAKDPKTDKTARDSHYATLRRQVRDAKRERGEIPTPDPRKERRKATDWTPPALSPDQVRLYGLHTVRAAIDNPERQLIKL
ncbi:MAG: 23S rRNA (guanosine(2251)-2'-O)-methyltransferase RlmB, partial [Kiritimatiellia bacterium]